MSVAPQLQRFVDDELARAPLMIEQVRVAAIEKLRSASTSDGLRPYEVHQRHDAALALQQQGGRFGALYVEALRSQVQSDLAGHGRSLPHPHDAGPGTQAAVDSLALMDEALIESDIEISRATMLIDGAVEWEQRELQTFTSALRGEAHVGSDSNPIRPSLVARALWDASGALALPPEQRMHVLRATASAIAGLLKHAYAAACSRLEAQGIEPSAYRTVLLAPGSVADTAAASTHQTSVDVTQPGALRRLLARLNTPSAGEAGAQPAPPAGAVEIEQALSRLDALMRHGAAARAAGTLFTGAPGGERTVLASLVPQGIDPGLIELLSSLFDAILADPAIPAPAKAAISRLQVSALRLALSDPALLDRHDHPTWRLMDRIATACKESAAAGPSRLAAMSAACSDLADDIARHATPDAAIYRQGLTRLEALVSDQLRQAQQAAHGAIAALQHTDRRMRIQAQVQTRMEEQFVRSPVGAALRHLLLGRWAQLLAEAILQTGPDGEATAGLTRTVDDLLWSLHPPAHPASRQRLVKLLPGLLARLRAGMAQCGLTAGEQEAVIAELEAAHTATLWPGPGAAAHESPETPEEIVRRLREEVVDDAPARRDFGDSVLDLSTLETVPAELLPEDGSMSPADERARSASAAVAAMALGGSVRLLLHGHWIDAQLLWRSEGGELVLFADTAGLTHALTRRALERLQAEGLAHLEPPGSLIQRAVDGLLARLAAN